MRNSIEISVPAACLRAAGVLVAHEQLAQAATHSLPQKIHAAIKSHLQRIGSEDIVHLLDDVRLDDGEIVFTLSRQTADLQHPVDLSVLRTLIYLKLGMKVSLTRESFPGVDALEHCAPTQVEGSGVDSLLDAREAPPVAGLTTSIPPKPMLPKVATSSAPEQNELISGLMSDDASPSVSDARYLVPDESASDMNPVPFESQEKLPAKAAAQVEVNDPANTLPPSDVSTFDHPVADFRNQLVKIYDAGHPDDDKVNALALAASESRETDPNPNGESRDIRPVPGFILQSPIVEEEVEVVEMCLEVQLVTLRGADASRVVVLDPSAAAAIAPGMNLADRLAGAPRRNGGLWELRSFRFELDGPAA